LVRQTPRHTNRALQCRAARANSACETRQPSSGETSTTRRPAARCPARTDGAAVAACSQNRGGARWNNRQTFTNVDLSAGGPWLCARSIHAGFEGLPRNDNAHGRTECASMTLRAASIGPQRLRRGGWFRKIG
jgi:hypothetical protein